MGELPEFLKPRLRLFLSADIVGSTALKQSPRDGTAVSTEWFAIIQGFYIETQRMFLAKWTERSDAGGGAGLGSPPELWKVIGDEIVFAKVLSNHRELYVTLSCWCAAIQEVRKFVRSRSPRLDVKCTGWTAGFPVMNKEVVVRTGDQDPFEGSGDYYVESGKLLNDRYLGVATSPFSVDYIGPAIDIGFRLAVHATPRRFVISVGTAYIISLTTPPSKTPELDISYDGATALKGVFGGVPYPIFWIDMAVDGDIALLEDRLARREICERDAVRRYCVKFFEDNRTYTFPPFIDQPGETGISERPDWYDSTLEKLAQNYTPQDSPAPDTEEAAEQEAPDLVVQSEGNIPTDDAKLSDALLQSAALKLNFDELLVALRGAPPKAASGKPKRRKRSGRKR